MAVCVDEMLIVLPVKEEHVFYMGGPYMRDFHYSFFLFTRIKNNMFLYSVPLNACFKDQCKPKVDNKSVILKKELFYYQQT